MCIPPTPSPFFLLAPGQEAGQHLWTGSFNNRSQGLKAAAAWSWGGPIIQRRQSPGSLDVWPVWAKKELSLDC